MNKDITTESARAKTSGAWMFSWLVRAPIALFLFGLMSGTAGAATWLYAGGSKELKSYVDVTSIEFDQNHVQVWVKYILTDAKKEQNSRDRYSITISHVDLSCTNFRLHRLVEMHFRKDGSQTGSVSNFSTEPMSPETLLYATAKSYCLLASKGFTAPDLTSQRGNFQAMAATEPGVDLSIRDDVSKKNGFLRVVQKWEFAEEKEVNWVDSLIALTKDAIGITLYDCSAHTARLIEQVGFDKNGQPIGVLFFDTQFQPPRKEENRIALDALCSEKTPSAASQSVPPDAGKP